MTRAVASRQKRNANRLKPRTSVLHLRRYGRSTNGFGRLKRRIAAHSKKNTPVVTSEVNTLDRHQSRRCPWSSAANNRARPALAHMNPAKLGFGPDDRVGEERGMP